MPNPSTTQRAYTLRLRPVDGEDHAWREAVWATHKAVNEGARVFGDWLLTFRGGLLPDLAEPPSSTKNTKSKSSPDPVEHRRRRRILLALSWLSVEDEDGVERAGHAERIVARGVDDSNTRETRLLAALENTLRRRNVSDAEIQGWREDCRKPLKAAIRNDAAWVDRARIFDELDFGPTTKDVEDFLTPFFEDMESYLTPQAVNDNESGNKRAEPKDLVEKAGSWLSNRFGSGPGADFDRISRGYAAIAAWADSSTDISNEIAVQLLAEYLVSNDFDLNSRDLDGVLAVVGGPGHKSKTRNFLQNLKNPGNQSRKDLENLASIARKDSEDNKKKIDAKGKRPYADVILARVEKTVGFTYLLEGGKARHQPFSVMLDHAARRVSAGHSWIKRAEAARSRFDENSRLIDDVPEDVRRWLDDHVARRAEDSGSLDDYRIRPRALDGWRKIVERWKQPGCETPETRIAAARQLQDDPEIDKFGDIQLFEALASEDAAPIREGGPEHLVNYAKASEAEFKARRFKVPAYRHPHPLRNPVFVDFGNSRWDVDFFLRKAHTELPKLRDQLERLRNARNPDEPRLKQLERDIEKLENSRRLELELFDGNTIKRFELAWSSKRLRLDLDHPPATRGSGDNTVKLGTVTRADRLGRAAARVDSTREVTIDGIFNEKHWNARLQAPRLQLEAIDRRVRTHGWDEAARTMLENVHWMLTYSAKLIPRGPWFDYCDRPRPEGAPEPFVSDKLVYGVKHEGNDSRNGHAKLILSRLPGLRVLGVDLGHRYAAACAVWEAVSAEDVSRASIEADIPPPPANAMFHRVPGRKGDGVSAPRSILYRRIASDALPDGTPHPAPWARLDRQFLVKLQGEDRKPRVPLPEERDRVEKFMHWCGRTPPKPEVRPKRVDDLMSEAVRTARLGLARHGRRARIAHDFVADTRPLPGGRTEALNSRSRVELLLDRLVDWHELASDSDWTDSQARELWNQFVKGHSSASSIEHPESMLDSVSTKAKRKQGQSRLRDQLRPLAEAFAADEPARRKIHEAWKERWSGDDAIWRTKLKWLSRWLMPRGFKADPDPSPNSRSRGGSRLDPDRRKATFQVGGLSLTRIANLVEFRRRVQVGYFTRMKPCGERAEIERNFGLATLRRIDRLKEQRVKQLVGRLVEAALGIGREPGGGAARAKFASNDPRFAPCHAIVIENLEHYRPEETRTRRENRATMDWKSAETRKRLEDHCKLYGILLKDVNPGYTSRQDSRTGAPGLRCSAIPVDDFLNKPLWNKRRKTAIEKIQTNKATPTDRLIRDLESEWSARSESDRKGGWVLLPVRGGELFVSAADSFPGETPRASHLQADLNAASNIALRALTDPDFPGRWWYVPTTIDKNGYRVPNPDKCKGATPLKNLRLGIKGGADSTLGRPLGEGDSSDARTPRKRSNPRTAGASTKEEKTVLNLWRDPAADSLEVGLWLDHAKYQNKVEERVVDRLRAAAGLPPVPGGSAGGPSEVF